MHVLGEGRIRHAPPVRHDGVSGLGEEERRIAHVVPHLADVFLVIAADAPDTAHWKRLVGAGYRNGGLGRWRDDVILGVSVHDRSSYASGIQAEEAIATGGLGSCCRSCKR